MLCSVHHIPGRLRIKNVSLKDRPQAAEAFCARVTAIRGVHCAVANLVTGSVVIRYHPAVIGPDAILDALNAGAFLNSAAVANRGTSFGHKVAGALVRSIVERLMERSAMVLVSALI